MAKLTAAWTVVEGKGQCICFSCDGPVEQDTIATSAEGVKVVTCSMDCAAKQAGVWGEAYERVNPHLSADYIARFKAIAEQTAETYAKLSAALDGVSEVFTSVNEIARQQAYAGDDAPYSQTICFDRKALPAGIKPGDKVDITVTSEGAFDTTAPFTVKMTPVLSEAMLLDSWAMHDVTDLADYVGRMRYQGFALKPGDLLGDSGATAKRMDAVAPAPIVVDYQMGYTPITEQDAAWLKAKLKADKARTQSKRAEAPARDDHKALEVLAERGTSDERWFARDILLGVEKRRADEQRAAIANIRDEWDNLPDAEPEGIVRRP